MELHEGELDDLDVLIGQRRFDTVCAHGLLMYLDDRAAAISRLADRVEPGTGRLSLTVRNGHALAMRPGLRGDWAAAIAGFDATEYVNELGVPARADRIDDLASELNAVGMTIVEWYGVRVFNDGITPEAEAPVGEELELLIAAEDLAGRRDPYRWLGSQLHVVAAPNSS